MMNKWTLYQVVVLVILSIFMAVVIQYRELFVVDMSASAGFMSFVPMLLQFVFIMVLVGCFSYILVFQSYKSETFLKHPIWMKMYIIIPGVLLLFTIVFITTVLMSNNVQNFFSENHWTMDVFIASCILLMNLFVVSVIHKIKGISISAVSKIFRLIFGQR
ncbi:hypothetical protein JFL43_08645 [Viridibacillus sp. YIM B01967]|uniref:Uncharacterized protein n=1 Tax=Viridibacillus soli TaxID=2798301 RepID=A0ABS1H7D4_9BACL|nr:hypothetical protein [Viridibacillus soli]MBK3494928.1 hypothetical protein [Viridibacillus soli]